MTGLTAKDRRQLAILYEYPEFKALIKWSHMKEQKVANQIIGIVMGQPGSSEKVAMLQGQSLAHKVMLEEIKGIHKKTNIEDDD